MTNPSPSHVRITSRVLNSTLILLASSLSPITLKVRKICVPFWYQSYFVFKWGTTADTFCYSLTGSEEAATGVVVLGVDDFKNAYALISPTLKVFCLSIATLASVNFACTSQSAISAEDICCWASDQTLAASVRHTYALLGSLLSKKAFAKVWKTLYFW